MQPQCIHLAHAGSPDPKAPGYCPAADYVVLPRQDHPADCPGNMVTGC